MSFMKDMWKSPGVLWQEGKDLWNHREDVAKGAGEALRDEEHQIAQASQHPLETLEKTEQTLSDAYEKGGGGVKGVAGMADAAAEGDVGADAVHRDYALQENDGIGIGHVRRDYAGAGHLQAGLGALQHARNGRREGLTAAGKREALLVLLLAAICAVQLLIPPYIGIANNGDWGKVYARFDCSPPDIGARNFIYFMPDFEFGRQYHWASEVLSSEILLAAGPILLVKASGAHVFNIRWLGAVHAALLVAAGPVLGAVRAGPRMFRLGTRQEVRGAGRGKSRLWRRRRARGTRTSRSG